MTSTTTRRMAMKTPAVFPSMVRLITIKSQNTLVIIWIKTLEKFKNHLLFNEFPITRSIGGINGLVILEVIYPIPIGSKDGKVFGN